MMYVSLLCACAFLWQFSSAHYTQQWALHISGGKTVADAVARDHGFVNLGEIFSDYYHFTHHGVSKRSAKPHIGHRARLAADERVHWSQQQKARSRKKRDLKLQDSDPRWPSMWYLNRGNGLDMNVIPAWLEGITGKGAVVTILDDGLEKDHPDLIQNYDPLASYDVNSHDSDPSPRYDMIDSNRHGTRCAGEVAATSNNSVCALGIAHGAQVGGVRMLDGDVTDAVEARSLSLNPQHIDIYSASWGPDDDGKTVDGPGELATRAFIEGVMKGRGGKGSIFVWASGNGGRDHDNCNCDGYTNSIYSLSISSATEQGHVPWYSEACSSTLASTYSSGALGDRQVITTDLHHSCTNSHTGTSASAPLAAGICALALQANPNLTWRDMQHIVVRTARPENLIAPDWQTNGVGRNVSHSFGYGLMDAYAMVKLAKKWITVPEQHKCEITAPHVDKLVPAKSVVVLKLAVTECDGVQILEHVQAKLSIYTQRRGDLHIQLTSPMGTKVTLLAHRSHDTSRLGFNHWPFMSVHSWGEPPSGTWQLEIHNDGRLLGRATLQNWSLILYGTKKFPSDIPETPAPTKSPKSKSTPKKVKSSKKQKSKTTQKPSSITTLISSTSTRNQKAKTKVEYGIVNINVNSNSRPKKKPQKMKLLTAQETTVSPSSFFYNVTKSRSNFDKTTDIILGKFENVSRIQVFQKYPNFQYVYPVFPARDNVKSRDSYVTKQTQKQKEISRDLNPSRNVKFVKNTVELTTPTDLPTETSKKYTPARLQKWELVLHGTETLPEVDKIPHPTSASDSVNVNVENNMIDDSEPRNDETQDMLPSNVLKISAENSSSGCVKSDSSSCLGLCLAVIFLIRINLFLNNCIVMKSILASLKEALSSTFHSAFTIIVAFYRWVISHYYSHSANTWTSPTVLPIIVPVHCKFQIICHSSSTNDHLHYHQSLAVRVQSPHTSFNCSVPKIRNNSQDYIQLSYNDERWLPIDSIFPPVKCSQNLCDSSNIIYLLHRTRYIVDKSNSFQILLYSPKENGTGILANTYRCSQYSSRNLVHFVKS